MKADVAGAVDARIGPSDERDRRHHAGDFRFFAAAMVVVAGLVEPSSRAEESPPGLSTAAWPLETIELVDGRRLEGVIVPADVAAGDAADDVRFVQVLRSPGRPMSLITWGPFTSADVRDLRRLPPAEHDRLASRVTAFRERRQRTAEAEAEVNLVRDEAHGVWQATTADLSITSTAEPATTRAAVASLELIFAGLSQLVPPRTGDRAAGIEVRLCGSAAEYRKLQRDLAISVDAPAFYVPARRLLVAGGDLDAALESAAAIDDAIELATRRERERAARFETLVRDLAADLEARGVAAAERSDIVRRARQRWEREHAAEVGQLVAARRDNDARAAAARETFRRQLAHEAWHAYADTRLHDDQTRLPAWLDEGLAQIVEAAPLEAGELRLDAPDPRRLDALRATLDAGRVPPLADLIRDDAGQFLNGHAGRDGDRALAYLTAWGVALDLALLRPVLAREQLPARLDAGDPIAAFEKTVGMPLDEYETAWRRRLRGIRGGRLTSDEISADR